MNMLRKITPEWALRITLGAMYLWSGIDIVRNPNAWTWAIRSLPEWAQAPINMIGAEQFLAVQGVVEIAIGIIFLVWFLPRVLVVLAALISTIEMIAIVLLVGVDPVTFRDIGLIGAGLALFLIKKK